MSGETAAWVKQGGLEALRAMPRRLKHRPCGEEEAADKGLSYKLKFITVSTSVFPGGITVFFS